MAEFGRPRDPKGAAVHGAKVTSLKLAMATDESIVHPPVNTRPSRNIGDAGLECASVLYAARISAASCTETLDFVVVELVAGNS
jgi:hypothetical protein